ncbi:FCD domain-containing protein [Ancylobacter pratisalsi]|uniref:FCD domain-containing protein n=1 Tax=Ancylobacter pratisalsi TaxID=1745854 RepID=UPI0031B6243F
MMGATIHAVDDQIVPLAHLIARPSLVEHAVDKGMRDTAAMGDVLLGAALLSEAGNRFLWDIIARQNQLRRLVEYRQVLNRDQVRGQCEEHLTILGLLEVGDQEQAALRLRLHLDAAKLRKAHNSMFPEPKMAVDRT